MGEYFEMVNEVAQEHLKGLLKTSGVEMTEENIEEFARCWVEKRNAFKAQVEEKDMLAVDSFTTDDVKGALVMTYSGSLFSIGPKIDNQRNCEYVSIGLRTDVPDSVLLDKAKFADDIEVDSGIVFESGPIKKSSPVYMIAVMKDSIAPIEQTELLSEVTQIIKDDFVTINKTVIM